MAGDRRISSIDHLVHHLVRKHAVIVLGENCEVGRTCLQFLADWSVAFGVVACRATRLVFDFANIAVLSRRGPSKSDDRSADHQPFEHNHFCFLHPRRSRTHCRAAAGTHLIYINASAALGMQEGAVEPLRHLHQVQTDSSLPADARGGDAGVRAELAERWSRSEMGQVSIGQAHSVGNDLPPVVASYR